MQVYHKFKNMIIKYNFQINANKNSTQADIKFKSSNTVKRKKLSAPVQKMLEEERNAAIEAYKNLQHRRK